MQLSSCALSPLRRQEKKASPVHYHYQPSSHNPDSNPHPCSPPHSPAYWVHSGILPKGSGFVYDHPGITNEQALQLVAEVSTLHLPLDGLSYLSWVSWFVSGCFV